LLALSFLRQSIADLKLEQYFNDVRVRSFVLTGAPTKSMKGGLAQETTRSGKHRHVRFGS
jgi:hypothetical protein